MEDKVKVSTDKDTHNDYDYIDNGEIPPVRNPVVLNIKNNQQKSQVTKVKYDLAEKNFFKYKSLYFLD